MNAHDGRFAGAMAAHESVRDGRTGAFVLANEFQWIKFDVGEI